MSSTHHRVRFAAGVILERADHLEGNIELFIVDEYSCLKGCAAAHTDIHDRMLADVLMAYNIHMVAFTPKITGTGTISCCS